MIIKWQTQSFKDIYVSRTISQLKRLVCTEHNPGTNRIDSFVKRKVYCQINSVERSSRKDVCLRFDATVLEMYEGSSRDEHVQEKFSELGS